ncbi:acyl-CoA thioesterase II [Nocardia otitidiscaviarum]|uniref:Acyl-CoA thioesterase 2 n=1 Tax=Nocardia otitidiscaviarum TaxID=1823 RepID=A0A378YUX0_9NOCA|nr:MULTISPECIES: acyl-CoA thioesterase II [Nocardia]MBF6135236.1 acyl-CoA thioesterase II [Nocardia otitidiscaviarum]MBF6181128.1 acyl-CoA thioesterase II [Nocardia otitidiscaviarum]MBF6237206.1 acyl-CoA thioesterase II [Nocardia otitidiscaviarum]MBF6487057.1 acyl-CoA thioesterase II [Nocardia otitidiscaviarum]MCP9624433.1 acyl-CoA thioesterase II [Nocardia otitidiscaviarum]
MATIEEALEIEHIERDIFRGASTKTQLPRTFGGQVAGQALVAAVRTVEPRFQVHSLHGYFLRPGNPVEPTVYLVDRIRDGRSFCTRRVTGVQNGEAIFTMSASFHVGDEGPQHQDTMPVVPPPHDMPDAKTTMSPERLWAMREWEHWDIRTIPQEQVSRRDGLAAQQQVWFRYRHPLPDDPLFHVCTLAYMSDMTLLGSSKVIHPDEPTQNASLDHAMWFLRPFRADDWLLYDQQSPSAGLGRALTAGRIWNQRGELVAVVLQEGLIRTLREPGASFPPGTN